LTKKASTDALSALHAALATALASRIMDGTATAADLSVAKGFLKDNGITAALAPGTPTANLLDALGNQPFDEDDELERQKQIFSGSSAGQH